ncbi:hypothetical protein PHYPSEUDO_008461 [Phytophthora pseudosyringae]|uniref:Uncharacterized protein n=1 Tax=Phytophthora pseudosyringae TaxID=221518 RepID=A0A8T1VHD2_9STRA|nr:hypothetical protein PHYPSEUDO_008461 [Phytophthora pseudosyringae]
MGLRLMCVAGAALVALLLLLTAAILRLALLLVTLVTLRYTLAVGAVALACWFVDSRRQRYAKGFYSCSRVPQAQQPATTEEQVQAEGEENEEEAEETRGQEEQAPVAAAVAPVAPETLPVQLKQVATTPPSETESEDDDSEAGAASSRHKTAASSPSRHNKSLVDVRTRSNTTDGELQRRQATRPRSSSAVGEGRSGRTTTTRGAVSRSSNADAMERKRQVARRRADTGMASHSTHKERSRRATFTSKHDTYAASNRSSSERLEDALRSDGYWIGDFRVQRRLVPRRSHANSPKAN